MAASATAGQVCSGHSLSPQKPHQGFCGDAATIPLPLGRVHVAAEHLVVSRDVFWALFYALEK